MSKIYVQPLYHPALQEFLSFAKSEDHNVEIATFAYKNVYDMDWETALKEHRQSLVDFGGKISFHGVFQDITIHSSDPKIAETSKERVRESLKFAEALGATKVVFHGNVNPMVLNMYYQKDWLDRNSAFWSQVLQDYRGTMLLENVWEPYPEIFRLLLDQVASPRLKICFDVGHANVYSRVGFEKWFDALGKDIEYLHLSDNTGEADQHMELGAGKIDWQRFTKALQTRGLDPEAVLEEGSLQKTKASLAYMKERSIYPF